MHHNYLPPSSIPLVISIFELHPWIPHPAQPVLQWSDDLSFLLVALGALNLFWSAVKNAITKNAPVHKKLEVL